MTRLRRALQEALALTICAVALGFTYTYVQHKGFFDNGTAKPRVQPADIVPPSMIHLEGAKSLFDSSKAVFIDARHSFDFNLGHIKGALSLPLADFQQHRSLLNALPRDKILVTYCDGIDCNSSIELAAKLYEAGYSGVRIFFGGWTQWQEHNGPVETGEPASAAGE